MKIGSIWVITLMLQKKEMINYENFITIDEYNTMKNILKNKYKIEVITDEENLFNYFIQENENKYLFNNENKIDSSKINSIYNNCFKDTKSIEYKKAVTKTKEIINKELEKLRLATNIKFSNLDTIIKKVIDDENEFYKKVASCLTPSEYKFIKNSICNKNCTNCTNPNCEPLHSSSQCCMFWDNKEEIGKIKVLGRF